MSLTDESIVIELLEGCARCGRDHAMLRFFKLERPMVLTGRDGGHTLTHWALCPGRREPIMFSQHVHEALLRRESREGAGRGEAE